MKYHIITFGCQMNISDSERIAAVLEKIGYKLTLKIEEANLIVINMCSVRKSAVDRVYGLVQKLQKLKKNNLLASKSQNRKLKIILTGCVLKKDKIKLSNYFDFIIDIKDLTKLPKTLNLNKKKSQSYGSDYGTAGNYLEINPKYSVKFSAYVPIMTGCNNFCAYCVVPHIRGVEVSRPVKEILCEVKNLIKNGCKEVWLLGQNVNSYKNGKIHSVKSARSERAMLANKDEHFNRANFPKLLKMVNNIPGKFWIRFTSSHPKDFSDELINVMAKSEKITPYLNLPIQSGDDKILKKMNRNYTVVQYKNLIKKIRKQIPQISLSTDIIVGFPGETKKQFENSIKLFKEIKYDMAYISEYSPRFGTAAAKMKDDVPIKEKARRKIVLNEILKKISLKHNKKFIGKIIEVLVGQSKNNLLIGKSWHYKTVKFEGPKNLVGKFVKVKITDASSWGLKGKYILD